MNDLMIDIETLGRAPGCVVHEVAALAFDLNTGEIGARFFRKIDITDSEFHGLATDPETVAWWNCHGGINQTGARPLAEVSREFRQFFRDTNPARVWSWGADFDFPILQAAMAICGHPYPLPYYLTRDARTVWDCAFPGVIHDRTGGHDAQQDCLCQISQICQALETLKGGCHE